MRELAREWIASVASFTRGHGGGERANASVGAAFVIGALVVAVLGLRWISAAGPTEEAADDTPWDVGSGGGQTTGTTIPASLPAGVVVVRDPGAPPPGETVVTLPEGQTGIFLPGFPPIPGGTTGTTEPGGDSDGDGGGGTDPPGPGPTSPGTNPGTGNPPTTRPGTNPTVTVTTPATTTTTTPPDTTTTVPDTTPPPDTTPSGGGLDLGLGDAVGGLVDAIGGLGLLIV